MSLFRISTIFIALSCALLATLSQPARADDLQDGNKLYKQGQLDKALEKVDKFLSSRPKGAQGPKIAQGHFLKGLILAEQGKNAEAIEVFTWLTEEYPELPEPYNNLAVLYASQGLYDKARLSLETAINAHPGYATAHENLGDVYAKIASQAYAKALQLDKNNITVQTKLKLLTELLSTNSKVNPAPAKAEPPKAAPAPTPADSTGTKTPKPAP